jgi:CRISPR-associated protein Cas1
MTMMGALYVDRRGSEVSFERGAIVVREPNSSPRSVPLTLVERVVLIGNVRISGTVLTRLAEAGASIICLPGRGQRRSASLAGLSHGDAVRRLGQYHLATDHSSRLGWALRLVRLRLIGQRRLLGAARRCRPDLRAPLVAAEQKIGKAGRELNESTLSHEQLRGQEGAATSAFFTAYARVFPAKAGFEGRNRRPPRDPVNAALSLGYTLAHGDAMRASLANGLDPAVGLYHQPAWNRDSLACDLVELTRARVERFVWRVFAERVVTPDSFTSSSEAVRLSKGARQSFFARWERDASIHRRWLDRAARVLAHECAHQGRIATDRIADDDPGE